MRTLENEIAYRLSYIDGLAVRSNVVGYKELLLELTAKVTAHPSLDVEVFLSFVECYMRLADVNADGQAVVQHAFDMYMYSAVAREAKATVQDTCIVSYIAN